MAYIGRPLQVANLAVQSGTGDGSDTTPIATLDYATTTNGVAVYLDGVRQLAGTDFNVTAQTTLTFTTAPANGVGIDVYFLGLELSIPTPADDTVTGAKIVDNAIDSEHYTDGSIDLAHMSSQSVDEDNLYISNAGSNGQFLSKQSGNAGGLTWAAAGGKVVQVVYTLSTAETSGTTVVVYDDTPQTITEGNEFLTRTITPTNSSNILYVEGTINLGQSNTGGIVMITSLFRDAVTNALGTWGLLVDANTVMSAVPYHYVMVAGTTSEITFRMRSGSNSAGTHYMNRGGSASLWGGLSTSTMIVTEISA